MIQSAQTRYNPYYAENPNLVASSLKRKALVYDILSKITTVAMIAILGGVFAVSFGFGAAIPSLSFLIFGGVLLLPPLALFQTSLHQKSLELDFDKAMAIRVAEVYNDFRGKSVEELRDRLVQSGIPIEQLPMQTLQQMDGEQPLKALLPLFAHFTAWDELRQFIHQYVENDFNFKPTTSSAENSLLVLQARRHGWARLEREELLASMNAATIQKAMLDPTFMLTTINGKIEDQPIAQLHMKHPDQRFLDRVFDKEDLFLSFSDSQRVPLNFEDLLQPNPTHPEQKMLQALPPDKMRMKIFNV